MSEHLPAGPPPSGPPSFGPPSFGPPSGPPPSGPPTEVLDSGGGTPPAPGGRGLRRALVAAGALVGLVVLGTGAVFAWQAYFSTGAQPAQALPADTIGYVSVDLDPSGGQKIEAIRTLNKFPAFKDGVGLSTGDDLREKLFDAVQSGDDACPGLDYARDLEPWLGDRFALAAVPLAEKGDDGKPRIAPVGVLQVKDDDAAQAGLAKLAACDSADEGTDGDPWVISGDWVVLAETHAQAQEVSDATSDGTLGDDDSFQKWTDAAGDPGILTAYAAPGAGDYLAGAIGDLGGLSGALSGELSSTCSGSGTASPGKAPRTTSDQSCTYSDSGGDTSSSTSAQEDQIKAALGDFDGAALTVRFDGGALELETATSHTNTSLDKLAATDQGGDVVETLPADTAAAIGIGFDPGWFDQVTTYVSSFSGGTFDVKSLLDQVETSSGLDLPADAESLAGSSAALSLGGGFDPSKVDGSDLDGVPAALKVKGDAEAAGRVLDKIGSGADLSSSDRAVLGRSTSGDSTAIGPDAAYRDEIVKDGGLGRSSTYRQVVPDSDKAAQVVYVNFDELGGVLDLVNGLADDAGVGEQYQANVEPLKALGISSHVDGDVTHGLLKITTN